MRDILEKINVTKKDLEISAFKLFVPSDINEKEARDKFQSLLEKYLSDINVVTLLWAGYLLNEKITKEKSEINSKDPAYFVADEILGMSIANYIGGTNAIFNFIRYDTEKPGILSNLDAMIDDIIGGLIAGIMTKIYE
jgi:alpha-ribazole phosphatase CobZ